MMEKNAVRTRSKHVKCPICGQKSYLLGGVAKCPTHGSAPFEMRKRNE